MLRRGQLLSKFSVVAGVPVFENGDRKWERIGSV
jgi:hypothetical protein